MMTYKRPGAQPVGKPSLQVRIPPDARHARTVRDALIAFSSLHGVGEGDLEALLFAVGEALANAIEHGAPSHDIDVTVEIDPSAIRASIADHGSGLAVVPKGLAPLPEGLIERGRGIPIMQRCTDRFEVESIPGEGTTVTMVRLRRPGPDQERFAAS
jgi:anti-sigma regulatory factor (Ser/Thr protein kinase)